MFFSFKFWIETLNVSKSIYEQEIDKKEKRTIEYSILVIRQHNHKHILHHHLIQAPGLEKAVVPPPPS